MLCRPMNLVVFRRSSLASTLSGEAKVLVDEELADARVSGGDNGEANDDSCASFSSWGQGLDSIALPRGQSSGGTCFSFRNRWEMVWPS